MENVEELMRQGNEFFHQNRWDDAERCYTTCIEAIRVLPQETSSGLLKAYSNRAETRLKKEDYELALEDSDEALRIDPNHLKALYRKGRAQHGLERYAEACNCLERARDFNPGNEGIRTALREARNMCAWSRQGMYDISDYMLYPDAPIPKVGNFVGDVKIDKTTDGRGLGLYATKLILPGQLLLVSNAVAVVDDECGQIADLNVDRSVGSEDHLVTAVLKAAMKSQTLLRQLHSLDAPGRLEAPAIELFNQTNSETPSGQQENENSKLDRKRIGEIISRRSFGGVQQTFASKSRLFRRAQNLISGLWLVPSFINHSCLPNSSRLEVGSAMFIHASKTIRRDEEITISYFDTLVPLRQREVMCERWDFKCNCQRCILERSLKAALKPITANFEELHNEALEETNAAQQPFPAILPGCLEFAKLFVEAEKIIRSSRKLTSEENRNWIRASFVSAYLAGTQSEGFRRMFNASTPSRIEVMKAIQNTVPGDIRTLAMMPQELKFVPQHLVLHDKGTLLVVCAITPEEYRALSPESRDTCIRVFGKHSEDALKKLVQHSNCFVF